MKLIIFDLDGTLIDTLKDLANAGNYVLAKHGFPTHEEIAYKYFVGNGIRTLIARALPDENRDDQTIERLQADFVTYYGTHAQDNTAPYPGINELLRTLKERGYLLSVASNKYHEATVPLVKQYFTETTFDLVLGHRLDRPAKPDPDIVFDTLNTLNVKAEDCLYLGDSSVDMLTAKRAGVTAIGVTWGFRLEKELVDNGADFIINEPAQLLGII